MKKQLLYIFAIVLLFSGCGANGPQFKSFDVPKDGKYGNLYIYRQAQFIGDGLSYQIIIDGELLGDMKLNGYFVKKLPANKLVSIIANVDDGSQSEIKVKVPKNSFICIRTNPYLVFGGDFRIKFKIMSKEKCLSEIKYTNLIIEK